MAKIRIQHLGNSTLAGQTVELDQERIEIGRRRDADLAFDLQQDTVVSGRHAVIRIEDGAVMIEDLGSTNGTFVNGRRISAPTALQPTDTITLGHDGPALRATLAAPVEAAAPEDAGGPRAGKRFVGMTTMIGSIEKARAQERTRFMRVAVPLAVVGIAAVLGVVMLIAALWGRPGAVSWQTVLTEARPSVYVVVARSELDGKVIESSMGTAWSVAPGYLATNAHVAELLEENELVARSSDAQPVDLRIVDTVVHPGYGEFQSMRDTYRPFDFNTGGWLDVPPAYDVALLQIDPQDRARQAPPLSLASDGDLRRLDAGAPMATIGFPTEGRSGGGTDVHQPEPDQRDGSIVRTANVFFGRAEDPGQATMLSYTVRSAGGASGSPVFDGSGRVIGLISSGDVIGATAGGRIQGLGTYGPRVDLVRELLEERARQVQDSRREYLEAGFLRRFRDGIANPKPLARMAFAEILAENDIAFEDIEVLEEKEVTLSAAGRQNRVASPALTIPSAGVYMLFSAALDHPLPLTVRVGPKGGTAEEGSAETYFYWSASRFPGKSQLGVEVFAEPAGEMRESRVAILLLRARPEGQATLHP